MIIMAGRTRLILLAGVTLVASFLVLAFAGPSAGAAPTPGATAAAHGDGGGNAAGPSAGVAPTPGATAAAHGHGGGNAVAARNGDNGTVKIHRSTTPVADRRNEPHVCAFYLDAFGFDPGQSVSWQIKSWPPTGDRTVVSSGVLALGSDGAGHTGDMTLPNGHYKLYWNFRGEKGFAKQKVFWVACGARTPPPTPKPKPSPSCPCSPSPSVSPISASTATPGPPAPTSGPPSGPPSTGGLPITGWPLALIGGAGAALLGTGGTAMVAARRRRGLHGH